MYCYSGKRCKYLNLSKEKDKLSGDSKATCDYYKTSLDYEPLMINFFRLEKCLKIKDGSEPKPK